MSRSNTMTATLPYAYAKGNERSWRTVLMVALCGGILAVGFFFAAKQHFSSMELGIKNSQLRKQLADLDAENGRLSLAKEVAMSPRAIRKVSHLIASPKVGSSSPSIELAAVKSVPAKPQVADTEVKAALTKADEVRANIASKVVKTALVKPEAKTEQNTKTSKTTKTRQKTL